MPIEALTDKGPEKSQTGEPAKGGRHLRSQGHVPFRRQLQTSRRPDAACDRRAENEVA